ncbi:thioredoxin X, chloroplastic-like [Zingiber officinale]|uniref:Thioredoxin domain-containing protein n=1 Tax=Zingiber officinale TaxID=94328 RepID=A0A8J5CHB3_ZINOF|nr:thioredoxin X, chloroplastic-like [Zingiber officinale]KAG6474494.1 hypothetical protein ZIOFF_068431 [Zingiber officinale]
MATTSFSPCAAARPPSASSLNRHLDPSRRICLPPHRPLASTAPLRAWGLAATPLRAAPARIAIRCGALAQIGQSEFATEVLGSELPVLVEFVADWCGPCRLISSVIEWASQEYKGRLKVVKIDHDANPKLISEYKVYGLPSLLIFKNGQEVPESKREGAITKVKLKEYLDNFLESTSVA